MSSAGINASVLFEQQLQHAQELEKSGNLVASERAYREILARAPYHPQALHFLGLLCFRTARRIEGLDLVRRSIVADPANAGFHTNHAILLGTAGNIEASIAAIRRSIELFSENANAHNNLGVSLERMGRFDEAIEAFLNACRLAPRHAGYLSHLGNAYRKAGRIDEAEACYQKALEIDPKWIPALQNLGNILQEQACHEQAIDLCQQSMAIGPDDAGLHSSFLYAIHYSVVSLQSIFKEHLAWAAKYAAPLMPISPTHTNDRSPHRRLRIGYVSPDFRRHSTATFVEQVIAHHDRTQFEIVLYSSVASPDDATVRFRQMADHWQEIATMADEQVAQLIRQDQIDILVDITGHMGGNRLLVFARKPAPIQITYIGHPDTTGMKAMDYRITDGLLDPPGCGSDRFQSEQLIRLPRIVGCYQDPKEAIQAGPLPALQKGYVTFGCLNNPSKITPLAIELWCAILNRLPDSRLVLLADAGWHLKERFAAHGIDVERRIQFTGRLPRIAYLEAFNTIDIALDCFPYNGHTTSCDGFWMGVPLVTLAGNSYVSRMGLSLLTNLNLTDWIAHSTRQYIHVAVSKAEDLGTLADLRASMRNRFESSPVMDYAALTRDLEAAFRQTWHTWCSKR